MATVSTQSAGQRVAQGFSELGSSTEALYKFGKVVSSLFHIFTESLKLVPGAEGISAGFGAVEEKVNGALKVMGATHIIPTVGKWAAEGKKSLEGKTPEETANLKHEHNFHTAQRVFLLGAHSIETGLFVDKFTNKFFENPAFQVCNVSILEIVKNGFHVVASICGLGKAGMVLDRAYAQENAVEKKLTVWKNLTQQPVLEVPEGEDEDEKGTRLETNDLAKAANEEYTLAFQNGRIDELHEKNFVQFSAIYDLTIDEDNQKLAHQMGLLRAALADAQPLLNAAEAVYNARAADISAQDRILADNEEIPGEQQALIDAAQEIIDAAEDEKTAEEKAAARIAKAAAVAAKKVAEEALAEATAKKEQFSKGVAAVEAVAGREAVEAVEEVKSNRAIEDAYQQQQKIIEELNNEIKKLYIQVVNYDFETKIERTKQNILTLKEELETDANKAVGDKMTPEKLAETQAALTAAKKEYRVWESLSKSTAHRLDKVNHITNDGVKTMRAYKIEKYEARMQSIQQDKTKSWISIAADIAKILAIVMVTTVMIGSFFFPVLTAPAAVLLVSSLGLIGYSIALSKSLYNATAPQKARELSYSQYVEREKQKQLAKAIA